MRHSSVLGMAMLLAAAGCQTKSASDYKTSRIDADIVVEAPGDGTSEVRVELRSAPLTFLVLTSDDDLTATAFGETRGLSERSLLGIVEYWTEFHQDTPGEEIEVSLHRELDTGAPSSTCTLPAAIELDALPRGSTSRASNVIVVTWSSEASTDPMALSVDGNCIESYSRSVPASAHDTTIPAGTLRKRAPSGEGDTVPDTCSVELRLWRTRSGELDPAFRGGSIDCQQIRTASFQSVP